jgi:hypothetical protein
MSRREGEFGKPQIRELRPSERLRKRGKGKGRKTRRHVRKMKRFKLLYRPKKAIKIEGLEQSLGEKDGRVVFWRSLSL